MFPKAARQRRPSSNVGLPDGVEDEIDAAVAGQPQDLVGELVLHVVDDRVGARFLRQRRLRVARDGAEHVGAGRLGELDGGEPDAAGGGVNEDTLPGPVVSIVRSA